MFSFLHAADIHLDSPLRGLEQYESAPVQAVRGATRRALANLVELAVRERVAFVVIAGDVYDGDWRDHNTGLFFCNQMHRLRDEGIRVFLIRGNHDAASRLTKSLRLPDNVHEFPVDRPERVVLDDFEVALHGQGFATAAVEADLSEHYLPAVPGRFNIGLLHTCATGREGHDRYAPCTVEGLRTRGYHYWALGHIHKRETLHRDPPIVFPGNIQGRHARETGVKGCALVTVDNAFGVSIDDRCLDVVRWEGLAVDATGAPDGEEVLSRFADAMRAGLDACGDRVLSLRVELTGRCPAHAAIAGATEQWVAELRRQAAESSGGRAWVEKVHLRTRPPAAPDPALTDGALGDLLGLVAEYRDDPPALSRLAREELADLKRKLPRELLGTPDGLDLDDEARLRSLLEDEVEPLLLARLLQTS
jgi:DNA repair exonuclease SbcCD nuclease subunit